ncbi:MAG: hypothetical protein ACREH3_07020, partial [Geminicoccales bacterium]
GGVALDAFTDDAVQDPALRALAARVRVVHDSELEARYPAAWPHRVTLRLRRGDVLTAISDHPPGGAANPLARPQVIAKFRANATPVLGDAAANAVVDLVAELDRAPDMSALVHALRGGGLGQVNRHPPPARAAAASVVRH